MDVEVGGVLGEADVDVEQLVERRRLRQSELLVDGGIGRDAARDAGNGRRDASRNSKEGQSEKKEEMDREGDEKREKCRNEF